MKLKRINQTAVALLTAAALAVQPAYSTGIPTVDVAAIANAIQQLMNWKARFDSLVREKMSQIPGVKQFLDARQESQIENMFQRREQQCGRLRKNNQASSDLCLNTVRLERQKYRLLKHMNEDITAEFNRINGRISSQGGFASESGMLGAISGMAAVQTPSGSGKAESVEQDVQAQLQALTNKIKQYEVQIAQIDQTINQLKWARKQLTKDQLAGNPSLFSRSAVSKGAAAGWLEKEARNARKKAQDKREVNDYKSRDALNAVIR